MYHNHGINKQRTNDDNKQSLINSSWGGREGYQQLLRGEGLLTVVEGRMCVVQMNQTSHFGDKQFSFESNCWTSFFFIYIIEREKKCNTGRKLEVEK